MPNYKKRKLKSQKFLEPKRLLFLRQKLSEYGFVYKVSAGLQIDLNTVIKKTPQGFVEQHLCDHNCSLDCGNYQCPAAFTENKGVDSKSLMSLGEVKKSLKVALAGLKLANKMLLEKKLSKYCTDFKIPKLVQKEIKETLKNGGYELNLFGGNPELHPNFLEIVKIAQEMGWVVTATTTGKKFMYDDNFIQGFLQNPPDLLAMSADDYEDINELNELLKMDAEDLKKYWQKANPLYGQRKKAFESLYVAKISQSLKSFPKILFNIVIHPGNLPHIFDFISALRQHFPDIIINPYPAQSSFCYESPVWQTKHLLPLEKVVDYMIQNQTNSREKNFVPRLHYWLALKSVFLTKMSDENRTKFLSGWGIWSCYRSRYLQAGSSETVKKESFRVGGHPGCFWNRQTVTEVSKQLWNMNKTQVANYLINSKTTLPKVAPKPCPGCIMPRLMFDGISTELGLSSKLIPAYLKLRKEYYGF